MLYSRKEMSFLNSIAREKAFCGITREWLLDRIALIYEHAGEHAEFVKDVYVLIQNLTESQWDNLTESLPFPIK